LRSKNDFFWLRTTFGNTGRLVEICRACNRYSRSSRVQFHVTAHFQTIGVTIHQDRFETPLKQMPDLVVAAVERLRVYAVNMAHQQRPIGAPRMQHKMLVLAHQATGKQLRVEARHDLANDV
jgi:hypothetical protein